MFGIFSRTATVIVLFFSVCLSNKVLPKKVPNPKPALFFDNFDILLASLVSILVWIAT